MTASLDHRVLATIARHRMIQPGDRVAVAVSGGADSVALLILLEELRAALGISLLVLHFHHGLRGAEADADEEFVARLAQDRGLEFIRGGEDVAAWAREHHRNLEDAGRHLRYAFCESVVAEGRARRVAVAHTADDQAESVLAHILRGTGISGLAGIHPVIGHVVRPLLEVGRDELRAWLSGRGQSWREDVTNVDTGRQRAHLRLELLPQIARDFQPHIVERLGTLASLAADEEAFWFALVEERFRALATSRAASAGAGFEISTESLLHPLAGIPEETSMGLSRRLIRRILQALADDLIGLTAGHIEQVMRLAKESPSGRRATLPRGLAVEKSFNRLIFMKELRPRRGRGTEIAPRPSYEYEVELPKRGATQVTIPAIHKRLWLKVVDWPPAESDTRSWTEALDADLLQPPFLLRNWQPGDSYCPRGRRKARKVKFLFREFRIAAAERPSWPVLTSGGRLVWVPGLPVAEEFAASQKTKVGLLIGEEPI